MLIGLVTCCCAFLHVVTSLEGKTFVIDGSRFPILCSFPTHEYLVTYLHWACYVLLRVVTRCYLLLNFRGENVCQITFQVNILYSFPTHEYFVTYVHWACYVLLRVVACCQFLRGEKVCQSTFKVPILYSFPTHEYLVTYGHWACYVLLRVVTPCYLLLHL